MVWAWLGLEIAGQATLFLLLLTFLFSKRLKTQRHPIVVNFVVVWLLSTFPALLLYVIFSCIPERLYLIRIIGCMAELRLSMVQNPARRYAF
jgi:hypothetical protein